MGALFSILLALSLTWGDSLQRPTERESDRDRAIAELLALVETTRRFPSPELRARVLAKLADALWAVDESLARRRFEEARALTTRLEGAPNSTTRERRYRLRQDLIRRVARHDPEFANRLLARLQEEQDILDPLRPVSERTRHLLTVARDMLHENPEQAARMVRETLGEGITDDTLFFLSELRRRNPQQADRLFEQAVQHAIRRVPPNLNELLLLGSYLFTERMQISFSQIAGRPAVNVTPGLFIHEVGSRTLIRRYLDAAFHALTQLVFTPVQRLTPYEIGLTAAAIRQLLPLYERHAPEHVPLLTGWWHQLIPHLPEPLRPRGEASPTESAHLTAAVERARKETHPEKRDVLYLRIVYALYTQGNYEAAREVARELTDSKAKAQVMSLLETAIWRGRIAQGIEPSDVRSWRLDLVQESLLIVEWAKALLQERRVDEAKLLLEGHIARVLADDTEHPLRWVALTGLLDTLRRIDAQEALSLLANLARALDSPSRSPDPAAPRVEDAPTHVLYLIGIGKHRLPFLLALGEEFDLERVIKEFARHDFEATLAWIHHLRTEDVRASLLIAACQAVLHGRSTGEDSEAPRERKRSGRLRTGPAAARCAEGYSALPPGGDRFASG